MIVWAPVGVPEFVVPELAAEDELQPESEIRPLISNNRLERISHRFMRKVRFGENARQKMLAKAIPCKDPPTVRSMAAEGAVVETVNVVVAAAPLAGVTEAGANVQVAPLGSVPQENFTAPLYPPTGITVSVVVADWPALIVAVEGEAETVKSGATTVTETALEVLARLATSPA